YPSDHPGRPAHVRRPFLQHAHLHQARPHRARPARRGPLAIAVPAPELSFPMLTVANYVAPVPPTPYALPAPPVLARAVFLYDVTAGRVLYAWNARTS